MKQIISIADMATIYTAVNDTIRKIGTPIVSFRRDPKIEMQEYKKFLKKDQYYQSLLRVKKTLENCNIEIEVPDIKVGEKTE